MQDLHTGKYKQNKPLRLFKVSSFSFLPYKSCVSSLIDHMVFILFQLSSEVHIRNIPFFSDPSQIFAFSSPPLVDVL